MAAKIHGWWLRRTWIDNASAFQPVRSDAGAPVYVPSKDPAGGTSATYKTEYGLIIRTRIKYAELEAVTLGHLPPSTGELIDTDPLSPTYGRLTVGGPGGGIDLPPLDKQWHQYTNVESSLVDDILDAWSHGVTFRSVEVEYANGRYDELDPPDVDAEVEE
jgi:hypothetical protein